MTLGCIMPAYKSLIDLVLCYDLEYRGRIISAILKAYNLPGAVGGYLVYTCIIKKEGFKNG